MKKLIFCVVGTRPEAIKMAPVIKSLKKITQFDTRVLVTGQHKHILNNILVEFGIQPDVNFEIMTPSQSLSDLSSKLITKFDEIFRKESPDIVLVQGDTTSAMIASLTCFYNKIPIGHIEAGFRTGDIYNPFPEEVNRLFISRIAQLHFAPTKNAEQNLLDEGIEQSKIFLTGNTSIDSLHFIKNQDSDEGKDGRSNNRLILVTIHRRENFGVVLEGICDAICELVERNGDIDVLIPVHPNPEVQKIILKRLGKKGRIFLVEPLSYTEFVKMIKKSYIILSDSGGVQEEAPSLSKPVLVLRDKTERIEAIELGVAKLVGTDPKNIVKECQKLLDSKEEYRTMIKGYSPYGDGKSAEKICDEIIKYFEKKLIMKILCNE